MNDRNRLDIEPMESRTMSRLDTQRMSTMLTRSRPWLLAGAMVSCLSIAAVVSTQAQTTPPPAAPKSPSDQLRERIALAAANASADSNGMAPATSTRPSQAMPSMSDALPDLTVPTLGSEPPPPAATPRNLGLTNGASTPPVTGAAAPDNTAVATTTGLAPAGSTAETAAPDSGGVVSAPVGMPPAAIVETRPVDIPAALQDSPIAPVGDTAVTTTRGLDSAGAATETASPDGGAVVTGTADAPAPARPSEMANANRIYFAPQDEKMDLMLQGEYAERSYHFSVPRSQLQGGARLVLSYSNSIQDLPERSSLEIRLNDIPIASLPLNAYNARNTVEIDLPPTAPSGNGVVQLLRAGENKLTFIANQRHRVTCSLDGTFELWTEIAADQTFVQFKTDSAVDPSTLAALDDLFGAAAGDRPMTVYTNGTMSVEHQTWGADVAQGYALRIGDRRAIVQHRVLPVSTANNGGSLANVDGSKLDGPISVLVGSRNEIRNAISPNLYNAISGPYIGIFPVSAGHNMVVISGNNDENVGVASEHFKMPGSINKGLASIVLKPDDVFVPPTDTRVVVQPESVLSLKDLGIRDQYTSASRQVFSVPVLMPPDLYVADDSLVTVSVNGMYMNGLAPDAILNVFINGRISAGIRLDQPNGEEIHNRVLTLPMREFKPGLNIVEFEAKLPLAAGGMGACADPVTPARPEDARFSLYNSTTLKFPNYPRLGSLPDLHTTATTAFPYYYLGYYSGNAAGQREHYNFYVPGYDSNSVSSAWTMIAKLAQVARQPLKLDAVSGSDVNSTSTNMVLVGSLDALESSNYLRTAPLRGAELHAAWDNHRFVDPLVTTQRDIAAQQATEDMLTRLSSLRRAAEAPSNINNARPIATDELAAYDEDIRQRQRVRLAEESSRQGASDAKPGTGVIASARTAIVEFFRGRENDPNQTTRLLSEGGSDMPNAVVMQYESPYNPGSTWTVLTAPDSNLLWAAARRLVTPSYWNRLAGEVTAFGPNPAALRWRAPTQTYYVTTRELNIANAQLVIGNWFSKNIIYWTFIIMGLLVLLGILTHMLVSRFGQSPIPGEDAKNG